MGERRALPPLPARRASDFRFAPGGDDWGTCVDPAVS